EVIGINTAIFSRGGGSVGIGFAVPSSLAKTVITQLADHGKVERGWLGVSIQPLTRELAKSFKRDDNTGALVSAVTAGSPADKAGIRAGDVIVEINRQPVRTVEDLTTRVDKQAKNEPMVLLVNRDGQTMYVAVPAV